MSEPLGLVHWLLNATGPRFRNFGDVNSLICCSCIARRVRTYAFQPFLVTITPLPSESQSSLPFTPWTSSSLRCSPLTPASSTPYSYPSPSASDSATPSTMVGLTSAGTDQSFGPLDPIYLLYGIFSHLLTFLYTATLIAGVIALLDEQDDDLKVYALQKLNGLVDQFWAEISDAVSKM